SLSKQAASAEKNMDLALAFELWKLASLFCKKIENIEWCMNRAMFCEAYISRNQDG
ncbi:AggR-activated transcriptional regulator Aar, partial [Escherichia coli]